MRTLTKIEHITKYEAASMPEIREIMSLESEGSEIHSDTWYDCDHVKLNGEIGRGNRNFITLDIGDTMYIVHDNSEIDPEVREVIDWWLEGHKNEQEIGQTWADWDNKVQIGVAYRGGSGYCYALYAKELKK